MIYDTGKDRVFTELESSAPEWVKKAIEQEEEILICLKDDFLIEPVKPAPEFDEEWPYLTSKIAIHRRKDDISAVRIRHYLPQELTLEAVHFKSHKELRVNDERKNEIIKEVVSFNYVGDFEDLRQMALYINYLIVRRENDRRSKREV